jgi:SAM-dependent methyltransferase
VNDETSVKAGYGGAFDVAADSYERARPGYPDDAIGWLVPKAGARVLDLGAGTGKLTRQLVAAGHDVVAVEPLPAMRAALSTAVPQARALAGSAEQIPLPDADVDAVVVGQAWHWFDHAVAAAQIARVLRAGGTLGLAWNFADESVPWVAKLWRMMHEADGVAPYEGMRGEGEPPALGADFEPAEGRMFGHDQPMDLDLLLDLVRSRSYVIRLSEERRSQLLESVTELVRADPALAGRDSFPLPYRTRCWRAVRR